MKLKHLPALVTGEGQTLSLEDANDKGMVEKFSQAFKELKTEFSKKLDAKSAQKAVDDATLIRRALVDFKTKLSSAELKDGQVLNFKQPLASLKITAVSPAELISKLRKRLAAIESINKQLLDIERLKNARMVDELREQEAKKRLQTLKKEYEALFEKPAGSAKMAFKKSEVYELVNVGIQYCDEIIKLNKGLQSSNIIMEGITDGIQGALEFLVNLFVDIAAFFYSIFRGIIRFLVAIVLVIAIIANPVAAVIVFIGSAILIEMFKEIRERSGEEE